MEHELFKICLPQLNSTNINTIVFGLNYYELLCYVSDTSRRMFANVLRFSKFSKQVN